MSSPASPEKEHERFLVLTLKLKVELGKIKKKFEIFQELTRIIKIIHFSPSKVDKGFLQKQSKS